MRSDWFVETLRSWKAAESLSDKEAYRCLKLIKAASVSAGGRVVSLPDSPDEAGLRTFALQRAEASLDRYARSKHGVASFDRLISASNDGRTLIEHLRDAVSFARERKIGVDAYSRDSLYGEFLEWRRIETAGQSLSSEWNSTGNVTVLRDAGYVDHVTDLINRAKEEILVAVGIILWDGTETHPVAVLLDVLRNAVDRGVRVRIFTSNIDSEEKKGTTIGRLMQRTLSRLEGLGLEVIPSKSQRAFHIKAVVVDRHTTVVGSHNWTGASFAQHTELSILCTSQVLAEYFARRLLMALYR